MGSKKKTRRNKQRTPKQAPEQQRKNAAGSFAEGTASQESAMIAETPCSPLSQTVDEQPDDALTTEKRAKRLYAEGKTAEALRLCLATLKEQGPTADILDLAGRAAYSNGQVPVAVSLLQKALALDPNRKELIDLLSDIADKTGNEELARSVKQELERKPGSENVTTDQGGVELPQSLTDTFGLKTRLRVVDIGSNPIDGTPPYAELLKAGAVKLVGFEPQRDALAKLNQAKGPHEVYYPHAVGDGRPATLHLCRASGMTSTLKPNFSLLNHFQGYPKWAEVVGTEQVKTVRLDDLDLGPIDWLKIDIQGGELKVFENGEKSLEQALVIQTEANFVPLYEGQPLFADIDAWMRARGFMLHTLLEQRRRLYAPLEVNNQIHQGLNQLTTADAVYVPSLDRLGNLSAEQLGKLAAILHVVYGSADLALRVLMVRDLKGGGDHAERFLVSLGVARAQAEAELHQAKQSLATTLNEAPQQPTAAASAESGHSTSVTFASERLDRNAEVKAVVPSLPYEGEQNPGLEAQSVSERIAANLRAATKLTSEHRQADALPYLERAWLLGGPDWPIVGPLIQLYSAKGRLNEALAIIHAWAIRCYENGDASAFADAMARYHHTVVQLNHKGVAQPLHDPTLVRYAEDLFAPFRYRTTPTRKRNSERLRVAYVIPLETEQNSTLTGIPVELAELHNADRYEVELFSIFTKEQASRANPDFVQTVERIKDGGWKFYEGLERGSVLKLALDVARRIRERECDLVVFHIQLGVHWLAALLRPAPVVLGIDWGHPQWYSSGALDYVISRHRHFRMEAVCDVLQWKWLAGSLRHKTKGLVPHQRRDLGLSDERTVIISSGSHSKFRDPRFWSIVKHVLTQRPNSEWVILGVDKSQVPDAWLDEVFCDRVHFLGRRKDFEECVTVGDIYVDTFPIGGGFALAPVVAAGIPCVIARHDYDQVFNKALNYSVYGDQIEDQRVLVDRSPGAIAHRILELVDDLSMRERYARIQREATSENFNLKLRTSELESLYEHAIISRGVER